MDEHDFDEFDSLIDVDMTALDRQSAQHPRLVWTYGRELANAQKELDYALADLETTDAELDDAIRHNGKAYGVGKVTELGIKTAIKRTQEHRDAVKTVNDKRYLVNMLYSALRTLDHRRTSLSNGVRLNESNYMAHPHRPAGESKDRSRFHSIKKRTRRKDK